MASVKTSVSLTQELDAALRRIRASKGVDKSRLMETILRADRQVSAELTHSATGPWDDPRWTRPGRLDKLGAIAALARAKNAAAVRAGAASFGTRA